MKNYETLMTDDPRKAADRAQMTAFSKNGTA